MNNQNYNITLSCGTAGYWAKWLEKALEDNGHKDFYNDMLVDTLAPKPDFEGRKDTVTEERVQRLTAYRRLCDRSELNAQYRLNIAAATMLKTDDPYICKRAGINIFELNNFATATVEKPSLLTRVKNGVDKILGPGWDRMNAALQNLEGMTAITESKELYKKKVLHTTIDVQSDRKRQPQPHAA